MRFEHAAAESYSDVASGQVLHSAPGFPAFPARLALELFDRARILTGRDQVGLWDPACGAGGLVTTLSLLRRDHLRTVRAGDSDPGAVALTRRNLALTTADGLQRRIQELRDRGANAWASVAAHPPTAMLDQLHAALPRHAAVVLISADRHSLPGRPAHRTFKHGKRHVEICWSRSR